MDSKKHHPKDSEHGDHSKHVSEEHMAHAQHEGGEHEKHVKHEEMQQHADHSMHEKHAMEEEGHGEHGEHEEHAMHGEHEGHEGHHEMMVKDFKKRFIVSAILSVPVLFFSPTVQGAFQYNISFTGVEYMLLFFSSIIFFYGGIPFFKGLVDEFKKELPGMMTLVAIAITAAYAYSAAVVLIIPGKFFFWELVTLLDVMLLGHWLEMKSILGASKALESLVKLMPSTAHVVQPDGSIVEVEVASLKPGDKVLVRPGEKVPADGEVISGASSVNEAFLTGESVPVRKSEGDEVIAGSINGEGAITIEIKRTGKDTYLSQVIDLVKQAQATRSKTQDLANKAAFVLTLVAVIGGAITFGIWMSLGKGLAFALERMVTVIVIACPHALGLAVPLVVSVSTAISANNGLLIRNRTAFERGRNIDAIVFDKTGTLTKGEFGVTDIVTLDEMPEEELLSIAGALEINSEHPIAQGIVRTVQEKGITIPAVEEFKAIPGRGVQGRVDGKNIMVVSPGYLRDNGISIEDERIQTLQSQGKTTVFVLSDNRLVGAIALADIIRPESREAIAELKKMGIQTIMLTGDNRLVAKWVAEELGLDQFFAEVLPHEKSEVITKLQEEQGLIVAMVGDGVNDAPALVKADLGIAIGAGTDVAIESADVILVRDDPRDIVAIIKLARSTFRKMQENLAWATGYNTFALPLAAGILYNWGVVLTPAMGAVLMSLSTVIVAFNAKRLRLE